MAFTPSKNKKRQNSACNNGTILAFSENQRQSTSHPRRKAPFLPPKTARTAGRSGRAGAEKRQAFSPASPLAASPSAEIRLQPFFFCVCRVRNAPARRRNVRFSGFRWVTRSAAPRKPHKPPTRARRAVTGVLSVRSTCVFNKIGIFSPCCVLVQLLHLPVIVLLECRLNRSDCE